MFAAQPLDGQLVLIRTIADVVRRASRAADNAERLVREVHGHAQRCQLAVAQGTSLTLLQAAARLQAIVDDQPARDAHLKSLASQAEILLHLLKQAAGAGANGEICIERAERDRQQTTDFRLLDMSSYRLRRGQSAKSVLSSVSAAEAACPHVEYDNDALERDLCALSSLVQRFRTMTRRAMCWEVR